MFIILATVAYVIQNMTVIYDHKKTYVSPPTPCMVLG
jgi:hypothetical protein